MMHNRINIGYSNLKKLILLFWMTGIFITPTSGQNAPETHLDSSRFCPGTNILLPVTIADFDYIGSFTITIQYDSTVLVFDSAGTTVNSLFSGTVYNASPVGSGTPLKQVILVWSGLIPVSLADNATLANLAFNYLGGTTTLTFDNTSNGGTLCEYADSLSVPLIDLPTSQYYFNGFVGPFTPVSVAITANSGSLCTGDTVTFTATPGGVAGTPQYSWYVNGTLMKQTQTCSSLTNGIIACFPFSGDASDQSGNNNDGTVNGASLTTDRFGYTNSAYAFDGTDDEIVVANSPSLSPSSITLSLWVKPDTLFCFNTFIAKGGNAQGYGCTTQYDMYYCDLFHYLSSDSYMPSYQFTSINPIQQDQWQHLVLTHTGTNIRYYRNGVLDRAVTDGPQFAGPNGFNLYIGTEVSHRADLFFKGKIDDVSIYNRVLSDAEVLALYNAGDSTFSYVPEDGDSVWCVVNSGIYCSAVAPDTSNIAVINVAPCAHCPGIPTVNYGGQTYNTVQIGTQCWLKENLNIGTMTPGSQNQTDNSIIEKFCYNDLESNCDVYGGLYQWEEMMNYTSASATNPSGRQGICPSGWHVPSDAEWTELITYLGGESIAGGKMKETGTAHWSPPNLGATNESGFTALPGGIRLSNGNFTDLTVNGSCWTSTESTPTKSWYRVMDYDFEDVGRFDYDKSVGFSVRCVRNFCSSSPTLSVTITASTDTLCQGDTVCFTANIVNGGTNPSIHWVVNDSLYEGLVAWYPFTGNANDGSGNGNNGIVNGASLTTDRHGRSNNAYHFNGSTDWIKVENSPSLNITGTSGLSISAWVQMNTIQKQGIVSKWQDGVIDQYLMLITEAGKPDFHVAPLAGLIANDVLPTGNWHHITCVFQNGTNAFSRIYVDGSLNASVSSSSQMIPSTNRYLEIGSFSNIWFFSGNLDDIRIYNRALSFSEILTLFQESDTNFCYIPSEGDSVYCIVTSSDTCAINNPDTSNVIVMTVNPALPVSVTINASANPVCEETEVTFTATPVNGGTAPVYVWKVNGNIEGSNSNTFIYEPEDGDVITCTLTSNANCATGNPAVSSSIIMVVYEDPETDGIWHN